MRSAACCARATSCISPSTGRSPDPKVARWQDRLTAVQRWIFGGCHLNQPIDRLVTDAGFEIARLERFYMRGPKASAYMLEGVAAKR